MSEAETKKRGHTVPDVCEMAPVAEPEAHEPPPAQDEHDAREAAMFAWMERTARRLLALPGQLMDSGRRAALRQHIERHDWLASDRSELEDLLREYHKQLE
jgi:hypothetical protein